MEVLERASAELLSYGDTGMSVMEMSHRTPEFEAIMKGAESALRELMEIPDNYRVLFLVFAVCGIAVAITRVGRREHLRSIREDSRDTTEYSIEVEITNG